MKLYEYISKDIFEKYGIPVLRRKVVERPEDARAFAEELGKPVVIKAQILVAGRGKAGGVKFAETPEEAEKVAKELLGSTIKGVKVRKVLVEEKADVVQELYVGVTIDRAARRPVVLVSRHGGVDIEEIARTMPEAIVKRHVDPFLGLRPYEARELAKALGFKGSEMRSLAAVIYNIYRIFCDYDAELVESNPLAYTKDGRFVALDARMIVDDNALFRHKELEKYVPEVLAEEPETEVEARKHGFSYVELDGDIGIIGNGAGLTMATMDLVNYYGGKPANFLDIGGGASAERVKAAVSLLLRNPRVKVIFANIFGGITRCDEVARGIVEAIRETGIKKPMVIRMVGTNEEEGRKILAEHGIEALEDLDEAAKKAVELAKSVS